MVLIDFWVGEVKFGTELDLTTVGLALTIYLVNYSGLY